LENRISYKNKYETQADKFAAELLIPDNYLNIEIKNMTISQLSCYFGVNEQLIKYKFGHW
ncbi:TPA: ImmA/IrrE family metallo-endopeptidase, partial [Escherichia coli]